MQRSSSRRESQQGLRLAHAIFAAEHDALTGLTNRGAFLESVRRAISRTGRGGKGFALLYLDLDHFKEINDTLGHPTGDRLLQNVAERMRAAVRDPDVVARLGGDEFAILQSDAVEPGEVASLAERVVGVLREPFPILGNEIRIGASIGITLYEGGATAPDDLLSQADLALYRAKAEGRGTYRFFASGMDAEARKRVAIVADLRQALTETDQLTFVFQPQVAISTGRIVGVEALVRWRHPSRGLLEPSEFISVAERSGLIVPLGRWALRTACQQARRWLSEGIDFGVMAVNVSAAQFRSPDDLRLSVSDALRDSRLPPDRLELELTEAILMEALNEQRDVLAQLRDAGVTLALDDFGTGFSSLEHLGSRPVDRLKIAGRFFGTMTAQSPEARVVRAAIGIARDLGLRVVAEGVETAEQVELLSAWGCPEAQGFYFSRPEPAAAIESLLRGGVLRGPSARPRAVGYVGC